MDAGRITPKNREMDDVFSEQPRPTGSVPEGASAEAGTGGSPPGGGSSDASAGSARGGSAGAAQTPARHTSAGRSQKEHILNTALSLMSQRGVDGTSMRDLANAAGLNVASLYHYFPSKRDLLVAVLEERGLLGNLQSYVFTEADPEAPDVLGSLLEDMILSMLEVEDFIRLMLGEVMRGDATAYNVGVELLTATQEALEHWLSEARPDLCEVPGFPGPAAVARMLRAMLVGLFFEHVSGVLEEDLEEGVAPADALRARVYEASAVLSRPHGSSD
jgi:AcrR family transcriptional regulator